MTTTTTTNEWVMFENAGTADFYALFFVGFTDKANNPAAIGMFGSGFKLAITSALRLGIDIILYLDREKITFTTVQRQIKGRNVDQLIFVRENHDGTKQQHETNLTLGYGAKDWKNSWGVFRELLANARDADPHSYEVVYGVKPKGREGFTRVFVRANDEILDLYRNIDRYFKDERHAMFVCEEGRIYPKLAPDDQTNFYCKGMYVLTIPITSLYDLDLYNMPINESRDASAGSLNNHTLQLLDRCPPDMKTELIRFAIEKGEQGNHTLENNLHWWQTQHAHAWADAFRRAFPDYVLCSFSDVEYQSMIRMGKKAVRATRGLYQILSTHGVQTAEKLLRDENQEKREDFQPEGILAEYFAEAFKMVASHLPEVNRLRITFVKVPSTEGYIAFIPKSRSGGEYEFSENLLKSGPRVIAFALIDAMAQTKSCSGKCDPKYEESLIQMILECIDV